MTAALRFYYDVVCPYAYLASLQIDAFVAERGLAVERRPVLLGGLLRSHGAADDPNLAMSTARRRNTHADIRRQGALHGRHLVVPQEHPRRTVDAMRLVIAAPEDRRTAVASALFEAYWEQGRDVAARAVLAEIAAAHGVDVEMIDAPAIKAELRARTGVAVAEGVFGVPTFARDAGEGAAPICVWGQDRLAVLARALGGPPMDPCPATATTAAPGTVVEFIHDFASPFSYLASTQIARVCAQAGAGLVSTPILLGALFRDIGTADVPLFTMHAAKQGWVHRDLDDWAQLWGVPLRFPSTFPIRTVLPLRVAIAEPASTPAIYRAAWVDDRPIGDPEVLARVLDGVGFAARTLIERAGGDDIKATLRRNTERARSAGVCGVPSFVLRRPGRPDAVLWGQDRLGMLAAALAGFDLPG